MIPKIALFLSICFCMYSCYPPCPIAYFQPFEMTAKVVDMDGKPIKNRKVVAISTAQASGFTASIENDIGIITSAITDNNGKAILKYSLSYNCDQVHYGVIAVKGDSLFKGVEVSVHKNNETDKIADSTKLFTTVKMDSLVPFKVRIKSNKNNVDTLSVIISTHDDNIFRYFKASMTFRSPSLLDTIINLNVYSKATFKIKNEIRCRDGSRINGKQHIVDNTINRNLIFLDEIN